MAHYGAQMSDDEGPAWSQLTATCAGRPSSCSPPRWRADTTWTAAPRSRSPRSSGSAGSRSPGCWTTPGPAGWCGSRSATRASIDVELSGRLMDALGLQHCVVTDTPDEHPAAMPASTSGAAAAELLTELVTPDDVLGLSWARSVSAMATCAAAAGHGAGRAADRGAEPAGGRRQLDRAGARRRPGRRRAGVLLLRADGGADAATARALRRQPEVAQALARIGSVTKAVAGVGAWEPEQSTLYDATGEAERAELAGGACAPTCPACSSTPAGSPWSAAADQAHDRHHRGRRCRAIPEVIGIVYGLAKVRRA